MVATHLLRVGLTTEGVEILTDEASSNRVFDAWMTGKSTDRIEVLGLTSKGQKTRSAFQFSNIVTVTIIAIPTEQHIKGLDERPALSVLTP